MIPVLRDNGVSRLLAPESRWEVLATGLEFTEGPLWLPDGALLFQDLKSERTYRLEEDGSLRVLREGTGAANGQTFDADERIVFCEQNGRRVSRMAIDGTMVETLVEEFDGQRLNSPNDVVTRSDGLVYFTDPAYGAPPDRPLSFQGVYVMDRAGRLKLLADDFEKPNGLALAPDERTLYVCDTAHNHVRSFPLLPDGTPHPVSGAVLAVMDPQTPGGPDGMKVDAEGRLYVAVAQGIWVFEPDGSLLGILSMPKRPSNLAWCGPEADLLAVTMIDEVWRLRLKTVGKRPAFQPIRADHREGPTVATPQPS